MTGYEWFCSYLAATGSHRQGQAWQCPAHDDARPSLSVNPAADGTALFYCHAGCSRHEVVTALGLEWPVAICGSDEPPAIVAARLARRVPYPAPDLSGGSQGGARRRGRVIEQRHHVYVPDQVRLERLRFEDGSKAIKWERKVGRDWVYGLEGRSLDSLPLYESQQVLQALGAGEPVVLCESESSVDALFTAGVFATTWAGGAAHPQLLALRRGLAGGRVVLIPDNDAAGVKCSHQIQESLGNVCRLKTIWPDRGQDARDLLLASGDDGLRRRIEALFSESEGYADGDASPPKERARFSSAVPLPGSAEQLGSYEIDDAFDVRTPPARWPALDAWTQSRTDVIQLLRDLRADDVETDRTILSSWLADPALRALVGYREAVIVDVVRQLQKIDATDLPAAVLAVVTSRAWAMPDAGTAAELSWQSDKARSSPSSIPNTHHVATEGARSATISSMLGLGGTTVTVWLKEPMWGRDPVTRDAFKSNRHIVIADHVIQDAAMTTLVDGDGEVAGEWPTPKVERLVWNETDALVDAPATAQALDFPPPNDGGSEEVGTPEWRERVQRQHSRAWEPWTPDEDEQLRSEFNRGQKVKQMARTHERTPGAITARLQSHGLIG